MSDHQNSSEKSLNVSDTIVSNFLDQLGLDDGFGEIASKLREVLLTETTISEKAIRKAMFQEDES